MNTKQRSEISLTNLKLVLICDQPNSNYKLVTRKRSHRFRQKFNAYKETVVGKVFSCDLHEFLSKPNLKFARIY